ncbi:MAG: MarR family transcriptional regulator [Chthoniobacterales bacterium]
MRTSRVELEKLGPLLTETARAWRTKLDQRLKPIGLSQGKWMTLIHLARGGNKLTQKEIAARMGIEEPTLAGLLDRLQNNGWIERRESRVDRRCKTVHLQRRSKVLLDRIFNTAHELRHELIADIPPRELHICMQVLTRIRDKADEPAAQTLKANGGASRKRSLRWQR